MDPYYCTRCGAKQEHGHNEHCHGFESIAQSKLVTEDASGVSVRCPVRGCQWRRPLNQGVANDLTNARAHFQAHLVWHDEHPRSLPAMRRVLAPIADAAQGRATTMVLGLLLVCQDGDEGALWRLLSDEARAELREDLAGIAANATAGALLDRKLEALRGLLEAA